MKIRPNSLIDEIASNNALQWLWIEHYTRFAAEWSVKHQHETYLLPFIGCCYMLIQLQSVEANKWKQKGFMLMLHTSFCPRSCIVRNCLMQTGSHTPNPEMLSHLFILLTSRDVLFEYHRAVVPFCWAGRPVRSLSTL